MSAGLGWLLVALVFLVGGSVGGLLGLVLTRGLDAWIDRRAQRAWDRGEPERRRRWAEEDRREAVRRQLHELEAQIREEQRSDEERAWRQQYRAREAAITREARRRLGLPDEEEPPRMIRQPDEQAYEYLARWVDGSHGRKGCLYAHDRSHAYRTMRAQLPPGPWVIHTRPPGPWGLYAHRRQAEGLG